MPFLFEMMTNDLLEKMLVETGKIISENEDIVQGARFAALSSIKYLSELKSYIKSHPFESAAAEIHFFKSVKPRFYGQVLYYSGVHLTELNKPAGDQDIIKDYFIREIQKINQFIEEHKDFYRYIRNGYSYLDNIYFLRENQKDPAFTDPFTTDRDPEFSTVCDYLLARISADKILCNYFVDQIKDAKTSDGKSKIKNRLEWTAQKAGLVELLYALHASGVFNNSPVEIKTIANYFSEIFHVSLGNIYKTYEEIRLRKKNRTSFLDSLRNNLLRKMEEDD